MNTCDVYPKKYRLLEIAVERSKCFVLMSFHKDFEVVYGEIKKALSENGYACSRADELGRGGKPIMATILNGIVASHFVIADLTGQNPNVFYELGVAHSFKDPQNIILIAQSVNDIPFDIRHLNTIIYKPDNIFYLTSNILKTVEDNKHHLAFLERIHSLGVIALRGSRGDTFIDHYLVFMDSEIEMMTRLLEGQKERITDDDVRHILNKHISYICRIVESKRQEFLEPSFMVLAELFACCAGYPSSCDIFSAILDKSVLDVRCLADADLELWQTTIAIKAVREKVCFNAAMTWIVEYFMRSKSADIDLNRYRLERFLLSTDDDTINSIIADSVSHSDPHVREHMADIIGAKKLTKALGHIRRQLSDEENIYSAASMITAIGKLTLSEGAPDILRWIAIHKNNIIERENYFILKHARRALSAIDNLNDTRGVAEMETIFKEHLSAIEMSGY